MNELQDINAAKCEAEYNNALQECGAELGRITDALKDQVDTPATWPRVGLLLAVRDALKQARQMIPMTETEAITEAARRG